MVGDPTGATCAATPLRHVAGRQHPGVEQLRAGSWLVGASAIKQTQRWVPTGPQVSQDARGRPESPAVSSHGALVLAHEVC